jgi:hypothetical protein
LVTGSNFSLSGRTYNQSTGNIPLISSARKGKYSKGSKYDSILDEYKESGERLLKIHIEGIEDNYFKSRLCKRINARDLGGQV